MSWITLLQDLVKQNNYTYIVNIIDAKNSYTNEEIKTLRYEIKKAQIVEELVFNAIENNKYSSLRVLVNNNIVSLQDSELFSNILFNSLKKGDLDILDRLKHIGVNIHDFKVTNKVVKCLSKANFSEKFENILTRFIKNNVDFENIDLSTILNASNNKAFQEYLKRAVLKGDADVTKLVIEKFLINLENLDFAADLLLTAISTQKSYMVDLLSSLGVNLKDAYIIKDSLKEIIKMPDATDMLNSLVRNNANFEVPNLFSNIPIEQYSLYNIQTLISFIPQENRDDYIKNRLNENNNKNINQLLLSNLENNNDYIDSMLFTEKLNIAFKVHNISYILNAIECNQDKIIVENIQVTDKKELEEVYKIASRDCYFGVVIFMARNFSDTIKINIEISDSQDNKSFEELMHYFTPDNKMNLKDIQTSTSEHYYDSQAEETYSKTESTDETDLTSELTNEDESIVLVHIERDHHDDMNCGYDDILGCVVVDC